MNRIVSLVLLIILSFHGTASAQFSPAEPTIDPKDVPFFVIKTQGKIRVINRGGDPYQPVTYEEFDDRTGFPNIRIRCHGGDDIDIYAHIEADNIYNGIYLSLSQNKDGVGAYVTGGSRNTAGCRYIHRESIEAVLDEEPKIRDALYTTLKHLGQEPYFKDESFVRIQLKNLRPIQMSDIDLPLRSLIARLDDDDWKVRERATKDIMSLGPMTAIKLQKLNKTGLTPEQFSRVNGIIAHFEFIPQSIAHELGMLLNPCGE